MLSLRVKIFPMRRTNISRREDGQDTHVPKTLGVTALDTNITCWTTEATGSINLRSCCKNPVHSNIGTCSLHCWILRPCVVPQQSHSPYRQAHRRRTTYTVTGCLRSTPANNLPVLAGIEPVDLRRKRATIALARRAKESNHLQHDRLHSRLTEQQRHLKSRRPFLPAALELLRDLAEQDVTPNLWHDHRWNSEWQNSPYLLHNYIKDVSNNPSGTKLQRPAWVKLNKPRTGVGLFRTTMHKWGMASSPTCVCGAKEQSADHIITSCPTHHPPHGALGILHLDDPTVAWLNEKCPNIWRHLKYIHSTRRSRSELLKARIVG